MPTLHRTIPILVRNLALPKPEKLYIHIQAPAALLPCIHRLSEWLKLNGRHQVRTGGDGGTFRDIGQEEMYEGPPPDAEALAAEEQEEREKADKQKVEKLKAAAEKLKVDSPEKAQAELEALATTRQAKQIRKDIRRKTKSA